MSLHPEMAWQLARAKREEAQSRISHVPALRAASLEQPCQAGTLRARLRKLRRDAPKPAATRRGTGGRTSVRSDAPGGMNR
jgi:hypothetical protein